MFADRPLLNACTCSVWKLMIWKKTATKKIRPDTTKHGEPSAEQSTEIRSLHRREYYLFCLCIGFTISRPSHHTVFYSLRCKPGGGRLGLFIMLVMATGYLGKQREGVSWRILFLSCSVYPRAGGQSFVARQHQCCSLCWTPAMQRVNCCGHKPSLPILTSPTRSVTPDEIYWSYTGPLPGWWEGLWIRLCCGYDSKWNESLWSLQGYNCTRWLWLKRHRRKDPGCQVCPGEKCPLLRSGIYQ